MNEMTIKERMLAAYSGREYDSLPIAAYSRYVLRGSAEREAFKNGGAGCYTTDAVRCAELSVGFCTGKGA